MGAASKNGGCLAANKSSPVSPRRHAVSRLFVSPENGPLLQRNQTINPQDEGVAMDFAYLEFEE